MKSPLFGYGTSENLQKYIKSDKFIAQGRIMYCYETDTKYWTFVQTDGSYYRIFGAENTVQRVNELPDIEAGNTGTLYICDDVVYTFNGLEYIPTYQNVTSDIADLQDAVANMYTKEEVDNLIGDLGGETSIADYVTTEVSNALEFEEV